MSIQYLGDAAGRFAAFESAYVGLRKREGRILNLDEIRQLPAAAIDSPNKDEWALRVKSTRRLIEYVQKVRPQYILDLGCGNGWLTHKLKSCADHVTGIDVNQTELRQADQLLSDDTKVTLICVDIFEWSPEVSVDLVVINAAIPYFSDASDLISKLLSIVSEGGEIHILDSPIYGNKALAEAAHQRSRDYFGGNAAQDMAGHYFHHSWEDLDQLDYDILYDPSKLTQRVLRKVGKRDSPFPWVRINQK